MMFFFLNLIDREKNLNIYSIYLTGLPEEQESREEEARGGREEGGLWRVGRHGRHAA